MEEQMKGVFESACRDVIEKHTQLVRLKGGWPKPKNEFENFLSWGDGYYVWDGELVRRVTRSSKSDPIRDSFLYFAHGEKLRDAYIRKKYGNMENAMRKTGKFNVLFSEFVTDFREERNKIMDGMEQIIAQARQTAIAQKRSKGIPQSHGGVANLLKVLTQTMKQQGSSIRTIAKVQYAVCMQAGIMIPDEFITDVLVAANIEKEGE